MLKNIIKLLRLKCYVPGYINFLKNLKAYNLRSVYIALLLGTSILVSLLIYILAYGDIEKAKRSCLIFLSLFNFFNVFELKINVLLFSFIAIIFILLRQVLDFLHTVIKQKITITITLISHRVLSFMNVDNIISINNGKVKYEGKLNNFKRGIV